MGPVVHPGEILADEIEERGLSVDQLGRILGVPTDQIAQILKGEQRVTADTALRLSQWLGTSAEVWLKLQMSYDLWLVDREFGDEIRRTVVRQSAA